MKPLDGMRSTSLQESIMSAVTPKVSIMVEGMNCVTTSDDSVP